MATKREDMCRVQLKKDLEHNESPNKNVISCLPAISLLLSSWASASTGASPPRSSSNPRLLPGSDRRFQRIWTTDTGSTFDSGLLYDLDSGPQPIHIFAGAETGAPMKRIGALAVATAAISTLIAIAPAAAQQRQCRSSEAQVHICDCGRQFPSTAKADWDKTIACQAQCMDA